MEAVTSAAVCHGLMKIYCGNRGNSLSSSPAWRRQTSGVAVPASFATFQQLASPAGSFPPALQALSGQQNICFLPSFCFGFFFFSSFFHPVLKTLENQHHHHIFFCTNGASTQMSTQTLIFRSVGTQIATPLRQQAVSLRSDGNGWGNPAFMPFLHFRAAPHHPDLLPVALLSKKTRAEDLTDEIPGDGMPGAG